MSARYWPYFLNQVRYPEIQHQGALALLAEAEGLELDRLYQAGLDLREQHFPARAEKESVLIHGQARGVPRHFLENDAQYRRRVVKAWAWQQLAGRHWGLHKIFAEYGFPNTTITPLSGPNHWAEFDIDVRSPDGGSLAEDVWELLFWIVFEYKRASAMLRSLRLVKTYRGVVKIKAAPVVGEIITLYPPPAKPQPGRAVLYGGGKSISHERWRIGCSYCGHLPPTIKTPLSVRRSAVTHEYWQLGGNL